MLTIDKIKIGDEIYELSSSSTSSAEFASYRWEYPDIQRYFGSLYNISTKSLDEVGGQYTCLYTVLNGTKKVRFSGATSGSSKKLAYVFVDESNNALAYPEFVSNQTYINEILDVPSGAYAIYINGSGIVSPHIELAVEDLMSDIRTLPYLLTEFGKRLQYKETFAWKPMDTGYVAFTFDDSLDDTADIVDLFISKGVPCCFGAIPERLDKSLPNGESVVTAMLRGVNAVGCEVLAHGSEGEEIVTADNIDDMNFLYEKFVVNKQKFADFGFNVRGTVRVGGSGNICNDPRTDEWVRLFFDYGDLYGLEEPYNHARVSLSTGLEGYKSAIDEAIASKKFAPLLFHQCPEYMGELIDYAIAQGAIVCNYATVYDTFGSTVKEVEIESKLKELENNTGSTSTPIKGTDYWTDEDVTSIKAECQTYIDTQLLGGAS